MCLFFSTTCWIGAGGRTVQQHSSVLGKQIGFLDLNQLVLKRSYKYAGISHTLKKTPHNPRQLIFFSPYFNRNLNFLGYEKYNAHVGEDSTFLR